MYTSCPVARCTPEHVSLANWIIINKWPKQIRRVIGGVSGCRSANVAGVIPIHEISATINVEPLIPAGSGTRLRPDSLCTRTNNRLPDHGKNNRTARLTGNCDHPNVQHGMKRSPDIKIGCGNPAGTDYRANSDSVTLRASNNPQRRSERGRGTVRHSGIERVPDSAPGRNRCGARVGWLIKLPAASGVITGCTGWAIMRR